MQIISFRELDTNALSQIREIYETSFPLWEREDFDDLLSRGSDEDNEQLACVVNQQIVGLATFSTLKSVGWNFLEYFAVDHNHRGAGLGSEFWDQIQIRLYDPVVIEVEHPEQSEVSYQDLHIRQSRIRFWQRSGFNEISVPNYRVPKSDNGFFEPLLLMSNAPLNSSLCSPRDLVAALYSEGYGLSDAQQLTEAAMEPQVSAAREDV